MTAKKPLPLLDFLGTPQKPSLLGLCFPEVGTPVGRRRVNPVKEHSDDSDEFLQEPARDAWLTPMNRKDLSVTSPWNRGRNCGGSLPGQDCAFSNMPAFPPLPFTDALNEAKTPETKCKPGFFTPPPAPSLERQQREMEEDVKTALKWNSVPMLSLSLLRGGRTCRCRFDHSLHEAVNHPHLEALEFLLKRGVKESINEACGGQRPLVRAIRMARNKGDVGYEMARLLLEHGAHPNMTGTSPLHEAAACASPAAVALLCSHGADPNAVNYSGRTPLHIVCKRTLFTPDALQEQVVEILLANGANPTSRDASGLKPSEQAADTASMCSFDSSPVRSVLRDRLLCAERWWMRRPAMLARHGHGEPRTIIRRLPDEIFQAVVRFL